MTPSQLEQLREHLNLIEDRCHLAMAAGFGAHDKRTTFDHWEYDEYNDTICIHWEGHGPMSAHDSGCFSFPLTYLLHTDEKAFYDKIKADTEADKAEQQAARNATLAEAKAKEAEKEKEDLKRLLNKHGMPENEE